MITRYGLDVFVVVVLCLLIASVLTWFFIEGRILKFTLLGVFGLLLVFTINFFRDPDRTPPQGEGLILSPADGKVVLIKELHDDEYVKGDAIQVSIFMSPLNVHVNRYPISGTVGYFKYFPGEFLMAWEDKASLKNERTHIGVENGDVKVLFKQIAGFVARRIVAETHVGAAAVAGERFGMIKFGSRVDVIFPKHMRVKVAVGDVTVAGESILAGSS